MRKNTKTKISLLVGSFLLICCSTVIYQLQKKAPEQQVVIQVEENPYFSQLDSLKKEEKWREIVQRGEALLAVDHLQSTLSDMKKFEVIDQLISSYFRLGEFSKAKEHAQILLTLGDALQNPALVANSYYKLSAVIRGEAGNIQHPEIQAQLFAEARYYARQALALCDASCPDDQALKAKILFNAGAAICDEPQRREGIAEGIAMYQEAIQLFAAVGDEDYRQRTLIRLGKAYLLQGDTDNSWQIIEELASLHPEERTRMHLYYLQAQVLQAKSLSRDALLFAHQGKEIANRLQAKVDLQRFDKIIETIYANPAL